MTDRYVSLRDGFVRALARLDVLLAEPDSEIVRDALIQRFEFTVEVAWKAMQAWAAAQGFDPRSPAETLRLAPALGLLADDDEVATWLAMIADRNRTLHVYREDVAEAVAARVREQHAATLRRLGPRLPLAGPETP